MQRFSRGSASGNQRRDRFWRNSAVLRAVNRVSYAPAVQTWILSAISMAASASGAQRRGPFCRVSHDYFGFSVTRSSGTNAIRMPQPA